MDKLKKGRMPVRQSFTKKLNDIKTVIAAESPTDVVFIRSSFNRLENLMQELSTLDTKIMDALLDSSEKDDIILAEREVVDKYCDEFETIKVQVNDLLTKLTAQELTLREIRNDGSVCSHENKQRSFRLPKIELKRFNGDLKEWLGFWAQFQKIHEDDSIHDSDKFQYLVQAMVAGSEPQEIVLSYPQTAENYPQVIQPLRERFGREDLLMQVYIRELLKLVISNATKKDKLPLPALLVQLESHLRCLQSLNLACADPRAWLFPLVESSLPEETLRAWQRSQFSRNVKEQQEHQGDRIISRLDRLMDFLKGEVQNEQQILLARSGFGCLEAKGRQEKGLEAPRSEIKLRKNRPNMPTVATLVNNNAQSCLFCKKPHDSEKCFKSKNMTLDQRKEKVKARKLCYRCLRANHTSKSCKTYIQCLICNNKHVTVMCPKLNVQQNEDVNEKAGAEQITTMSDLANLTCVKEVVLQTLMINLRGKHKQKKVRAFLDTGSQRSYLLKRTAEELGLDPCGEEIVTHVLFGGNKITSSNHKKYRVDLIKPGGDYECQIEVRDQVKICQLIPRIAKSRKLMKELKKNGIWINDVGDDHPEIELLIGIDIYSKIITGNVVPLENGLTAIETKLGWTLGGERCDSTIEGNFSNVIISMVCDEENPIGTLWDLEVIGIQDSADVKTEDERNREIQQNLLRTLKQDKAGRYKINLPWVEGHPVLSSNRQTAEKRLRKTTEKLHKANLFNLYSAVFGSWKREGFIEEAIDEGCHFLPHRPVFKPTSLTTPVRPVFDASCVAETGVSLNDCLEKGPNYVQLIPEILLRFREKKVGVTSDIRKVFQMIEVAPEDRQYLCFLWWEDEAKGKIKVYRHTRVVFGTTCSPFILGAVLDYHLSNIRKEDEETSRKLKESLYVDNCVTSVASVEEYEEFREASTRILAEAQMELRNWESTKEDIISRHDEDDEGTRNTTEVLGLEWNRETDTLGFPIGSKFTAILESITKRNLLSLVHKIFDTIRVLAPALLPFKLLVREAWNVEAKQKSIQKGGKSTWDSPLPESIAHDFRKRFAEISCLSEINVPRSIASGSVNRRDWSLHTFTDASQLAYAAAVFLRAEGPEGVSVELGLAKARVAPQKTITIPRMELLGCLIGSRYTYLIRSALHLEEVKEYLWTDSSTALARIKKNENWATFVGNRVQEIRKLTKIEDWRFIPGKHNPADLVSRGCSPSQLKESRWWNGPKWLRSSADQWPSVPVEDEDENLIMAVKKKSIDKSITMTTLEMTRNLTYSQRVRIMSWSLRFLNNTKRGNNKQTGPLTYREIKNAELRMIRWVQQESLPKGGDSINGIQVARDDLGLIRVKTKILMRNDLTDFKYPLLLPKEHEVVEALIEEQHRLNCHAGVQFLMVQIRKRFWILQSRRAIKKVIARCMQCKRQRAANAESEPTPLPGDRVKDGRVFEVVGVDLAGPLYLKDKSKVWVVLFTCAVCRAVQLELVSSLSTEAFVLSFRRFVARRGRPSVVYSDNGTNFVGTARALENSVQPKLQTASGWQDIEWKFNPPTASWWGGWWERLIRTTKEMMRRMLGKSVLTYEELLTSLCDIESVVNGRPLTYVSENPEDLTPLTPAMFLHDTGGFHVSDLDQLESQKFQSRLRHRHHLMKEFRQRFRKEYLAQLVQRPKGKRKTQLKEGDIVLLGSEKIKRVEWPLAKIEKLIVGRDGVSRVAKLRTEDGVLIRPIERLYPLEVNSPDDIAHRSRVSSSSNSGVQTFYTTRSGRKVVPKNTVH